MAERSRIIAATADLETIANLVGPVDTRNLTARIRVLLERGEPVVSVLTRLNLPARAEEARVQLEEPEVPVLDRTLVERRREVRPVDPPMESLTCGACDRTWYRPRVRGQKPKRCPECR